jgi:hypothetical protein
MMTAPTNETESEQTWRIWRDGTAWLRITDEIRLEITTPEDDGMAAESEAEPVQLVLELVTIERLARCIRC